jgi:hypothetical protein
MNYLHDTKILPDVERFISVNPALEPPVSLDYFLSTVSEGSRVSVAINPNLDDEKAYTVVSVMVLSAVHGAIILLTLREDDGKEIIISFPDVVLITENPMLQSGHKFYFYSLQREDFFSALEELRLSGNTHHKKWKCITVYRLIVHA